MKLRTALVGSIVTLVVVALAAQTPAPTPQDRMYAAIRGGDTAAVAALLQGGADVNMKDRRGGATPLMNAAAVGSIETMRLLVEKGADVNARSAANATALMWAVTDLAKVQLLVDKGADVNAVSELKHTPLMLAAMSDRSAAIVRLLLARGADPKALDADKTTTLVAATRGDDIETIRQIVNAGVDVNAADGFGATPLMNTAANGNVTAVQLLLQKGARVNVVSGDPADVPGNRVKNGIIPLGKFTPLILSAAFGPDAIVKALIDAGADVNAQDARGMTPLMYALATDHGDPATVKTLLARRPNLALKDFMGQTAGDFSVKSGDPSNIALLKQAGAPTSPASSQASGTPAPVAVRPAVERGVATLERMSNTFFTNGACGACHAQNITDIAVMSARRHGVRINDEAAAQRAGGAAAQFGSLASALLERVDGPAVDIQLYTLSAFASAAYPPDRATDALVANVVAQQAANGSWHAGGIPRPPVQDGDVSRTALGVRALKTYGPPGRGSEMRARTQSAVKWLQAARPITQEDRAYRLLGMAWGGVDAPAVQRAAREVVALQRQDGGWSQRAELASDAYATGLTLFALRESGALPASDRAVQRAAEYLLSTQRGDGTWYVRSRAAKFQPYFESGFPYGHDQWISSMATGWATAALATTLPESGPRQASR